MDNVIVENVDMTQWDYIQIHRNYIHKAEEALNIQKEKGFLSRRKGIDGLA